MTAVVLSAASLRSSDAPIRPRCTRSQVRQDVVWQWQAASGGGGEEEEEEGEGRRRLRRLSALRLRPPF